MACYAGAAACNSAADHADIAPGTYHAFAAFSDLMSWSDAADACTAKGMILAAVTNVKQFTAIRKMIKNRVACSQCGYWMGGRSTAGVWTWPWDANFHRVSNPCTDYAYGGTAGALPWKSGEPSSSNNRCLSYQGANEKWDAGPCTQDYRYVCQVWSGAPDSFQQNYKDECSPPPSPSSPPSPPSPPPPPPPCPP